MYTSWEFVSKSKQHVDKWTFAGLSPPVETKASVGELWECLQSIQTADFEVSRQRGGLRCINTCQELPDVVLLSINNTSFAFFTSFFTYAIDSRPSLPLLTFFIQKLSLTTFFFKLSRCTLKPLFAALPLHSLLLSPASSVKPISSSVFISLDQKTAVLTSVK